jgi:hypothetical protein
MLKFKIGDKVVDSWYPEAGTGVITKILKTRIKVYFERATFKGGWQCPLFRDEKDGELTYDKPHYKFLKHEQPLNS